MSWAISDIEDLVMERPRLGVALLQILAASGTSSSIAGSRAFPSTPSSGGSPACLIRFADRLGVSEDDGSVRMMPFTHEAAVTLRGDFARDRHAIYEPVPPSTAFAQLFAARHHPPSRISPRQCLGRPALRCLRRRDHRLQDLHFRRQNLHLAANLRPHGRPKSLPCTPRAMVSAVHYRNPSRQSRDRRGKTNEISDRGRFGAYNVVAGDR